MIVFVAYGTAMSICIQNSPDGYSSTISAAMLAAIVLLAPFSLAKLKVNQ